MHIEVDHPCVQHKMAILRDKNTEHKEFREIASEITLFLCYEALKHLDLVDVTVETPLATTSARKIANDVLLIPILRAGVGMLEGALNLIPTARVGFVGLYRDPETKLPVEYYQKLPADARDPVCIVLDPMLATGGSTVAALDLLKREGFPNIVVVSIISCPEGIAAVEAAHADVTIYIGSIDEGLDDHKYIVPGLGDAGDRLYGTK
ncbi:MAG: uracil phosphoribosyltransferase [Lentisphaerae bacterium]|nr:uracil phosphoribosyltransferase [Lentisphaerota bacterium]